MSWKDTLKMVAVGIPPGEKQFSRHGSVPVPSEATLELPAEKITVYYAESQKAGSAGKVWDDAVEPRVLLG